MDPQTLAIILLVIHILVGIVFCFFGSRWIKIIVGVYGFVLGFLLAYTLLPMFTSVGGLTVLLISLGIGAVGALLFVFFVYAGVFFIGFGAGLLLSLLIINVFSLDILQWYVYVPVLVISCALGALTLNKQRIFLSIFTAYIGASSLALFIYSMINGVDAKVLSSYSDPQSMYRVYASAEYLIALAALFVAGVVVQLAVTSKKQNRKKS